MREAAETYREAGLPADLALAAEAVFAHWNDDRDDFAITLTDTLAHLR